MGVVYLETSALLRAVFGERDAAAVRARLSAADRVVSSRLLRVEAERAVLRAALDRPEIDRALPALERELRAVWPHVDFWELTPAVCELAGRIAPRCRLGSLDALHLATFQLLQQLDPGATMLSFDRRVLDALASAPP